MVTCESAEMSLYPVMATPWSRPDLLADSSPLVAAGWEGTGGVRARAVRGRRGRGRLYQPPEPGRLVRRPAARSVLRGAADQPPPPSADRLATSPAGWGLRPAA